VSPRSSLRLNRLERPGIVPCFTPGFREKRDPNEESRTFPRSRFNLELSADEENTFFHAPQAEVRAVARALGSRAEHRFNIKAFSIVLDDERHVG